MQENIADKFLGVIILPNMVLCFESADFQRPSKKKMSNALLYMFELEEQNVL